MRSIIEFWSSFRLLPSAWLLLVQFILLILAMLTFDNEAYRTLTWALGVLALLIIAKVIRQTPMFTFLGLAFVSGAIIASVFILLGYSNLTIQIFAHSCEALAYFSAAYGLFRYMFADRYLTRDELFAGHCCKVSDEAAFCLIQRPYISKTLLTRRISPRGSP